MRPDPWNVWLMMLGTLAAATTACSTSTTARSRDPVACDAPCRPGPAEIAEPLSAGLSAPGERVEVSKTFTRHWRDGKAELSGYEVTTMRYGHARKGHAVLIYVTEPMDRRTWIKDDALDAGDHQVDVLKLNHQLTFRTGIYPYSVMTSVFAPVGGQGRERFAPAKISLTAQEWCGHVYHQLHPKGTRLHGELHSYFGSEGNRRQTIATPAGTLYEDALLIQLRELDGPFAGGGDWSGSLVPSLWWTRTAHRPPRPVPATIRRSLATRDGARVTRFEVERAGVTWTYDVEQTYPHRILGWSSSRGERGRLLGSTRLPYWKLNGPGHERYLEQLGLQP